MNWPKRGQAAIANEPAGALIRNPDVAKVCFTGSVGGGKKMMEMASASLTRVTLELGGNDAAVILKDAILDYDMTPDFGFGSKVSFGQMPIPIGFDLEKSDADRELPERATYNRTLFNAEDWLSCFAIPRPQK